MNILTGRKKLSRWLEESNLKSYLPFTVSILTTFALHSICTWMGSVPSRTSIPHSDNYVQIHDFYIFSINITVKKNVHKLLSL